jgi:hypothetical protein
MKSARKHLIAALCLLLGILLLANSASGYSVLTHEQIVDLLWDQQIKPLMLQRFPGSTPDQLREAHSYAYGGCLIQDMGYYPFGSKYFSNLLHYVRSGDFVVTLISDSQDLNEYAFALGALSHYAADISGHPTVNRAVAMLFPKLSAKYGGAVTYAQDKKAHIRTEFGFDMAQVAKSRYAPDAYHDFIGFHVAKPALERAFLKTYGIELNTVLTHEDLSIGSYRRSISVFIPKLTQVALKSHKVEIFKDPPPGYTKKKFLYNLRRADYEKEFGKTYKRPGIGTRLLVFLFRVIPKVGPFSAFAFKAPTPKIEEMYFKSVNDTVDVYRADLAGVKNGGLNLPDDDFDTGKPTKAGEYSLTDETYARLLHDLTTHKFDHLTPDLRQNLLGFYADLNAPISTKKHASDWQQTLRELDQLRAAPPVVSAGALPATP